LDRAAERRQHRGDRELTEQATNATREERVLAAAFHLSWMVGAWPQILLLLYWLIRGRSPFLGRHFVQSGLSTIVLGPLMIAGLLFDAVGFWLDAAFGVSVFVLPGNVALLGAFAIAGLFALGLNVAGAHAAYRGRAWTDPICRAGARWLSERATGSPVEEADRLLAAACYFSPDVALVSFLVVDRSKRFVRFHALQGVLLYAVWMPLIAGAAFLGMAFAPASHGEPREFGIVAPLVLSLPILGGLIAMSVVDVRSGVRAARGELFSLPLVGRVATWWFGPDDQAT
jgi:uncharacterized membrane protein